MNNKLFDLLNQLEAIQILIEADGNEMSIICSENYQKTKELQKEVDALSSKKVDILKELRQEILYKKEQELIEKPKIAKKEVVVRSNGRKKG
jgi:hypothetical protein